MKRYQWMMAAAALCGAMVIGSGCGKKAAPETSPAQPSTTVSQSTSAAEPQSETEPESISQELKGEIKILQGTITLVKDEGAAIDLRGDDGKDYTIDLSVAGDVEADIKKDSQVAVFYKGSSQFQPKEDSIIIILPDQEEWTIYEETGTTLFNAMSSFTMKTDDNREISLLKDNCPIEDGALTKDSGDQIKVYYVTSEGTNFPLEIQKG